ncbi:sulfatase-like hydrolase/transferase [Streptomyces sp. NPDC086787]|uniref:sulfatase-like hydrolase/transferase n=1 Tax=Streptomyces sp. NPDC086787 TaxID=3365759 RepID=UPI0038217199
MSAAPASGTETPDTADATGRAEEPAAGTTAPGTDPDDSESADRTEEAAAASTADVVDDAADAEPDAAPNDTPADADAAPTPEPAPEKRSRRTPRRIWRAWRSRYPLAAQVVSVVVTVLAAVLVQVCLLMPNTLDNLRLVEFMRLPAEAVMGAVVLLALPRRPRLVVSAVAGAVLGAVAVLNMLDMGFNEYLGRDFNVVLDWSLFADARGYLRDTLGGTAELGLTVGVVVLVLLLIAAVALSTVRIGNLLARHRASASRGTLVVGTVWITCTALGLTVGGFPAASKHTADVLKNQARSVRDTLRDEAEFQKIAKVDRFGNTPPGQLVPDLRGKDMVFTFIESYGRSAIEDPIEAPGVDKTLDERTAALAKAGFHAKSGWLTSATYGGSSWLGHSTTLTGLWISNQQRYRTVMASDHLSLTKVFKKTGAYDTVGVMPGIQKGWPEQKYYGLDKVYNAFQLGYQGPKFSWSTMPDQYALEQFQQRVHGKRRADGKQLMSEIILTSSHQPWAPIPRMVDWDRLGDGSVFKDIQAAGNKASDVIADTTKSRQEYGKSIQYSVTALTQWLERYGDDNTVLVFLGDHQPIARVSGTHASRDVPISIVAKDPKVLDKIAGWNWTDGLRPAHNAPVWKMSSFRDRFLTAYGSTPHPKKG